MPHFQLRIVTLAAGVAGTSLLVAVASSGTTNANPPPMRGAVAPAGRTYPATATRTYPSARQPYGALRSRSLRARSEATPAPCPTSTGHTFVGIPGVNDYADATDAAVLGGDGNDACGKYDGIGAGGDNHIAAADGYSFVAGGAQNSILANQSFDGAGYQNFVSGNNSLVGAGEQNSAAGGSAMVGAGEMNTAEGDFSGVLAGAGNFSDASYSFVGGGEGNQATGTSAFVGGGYYGIASGNGSVVVGGDYADGSTSAVADEASGNDAFVGAGDVNIASAQASSIVGGQYNSVNSEFGAVVGGSTNMVTGMAGVIGAGTNNVAASYAFDGAGEYNQALGSGAGIAAGGSLGTGNEVMGQDSFVGAGDDNNISANEAFIGSGSTNSISSAATYASILGGNRNSASGQYASVIGGFGNSAAGSYAIVAGGDTDSAAATLTFAAGYHADATHSGSFVWSDYSSGSTAVKDTAANQFVIRASGGTTIYSNEAATSGVSLAAGSGTWASLSDRNAKTGIVPLDDDAVLAKVAKLPVDGWRYKSEAGVRHVGPMAQDFYAAFGVGADNRHITSIDEDGVALAAIKALHANLVRVEAADRRKDGEIGELRSRLSATDARDAAMERRLEALEARR